MTTERQLTFNRPANEHDQAYIAATWASSIHNGKRSSKGDTNATIDRVLDHHSTRILVASLPAAPRFICGWLCYVPLASYRVVNYLYVRKQWRGQGVAGRLVREAWPISEKSFVYTFRGPDSTELATKYRAMLMPISEVLT